MNIDTFLATHEETLRSLLGYWPVTVRETKKYGQLTKYTLGPLADGRWAMIHHINAPDEGPPHDHPCQMESHGIQGSYVERIYRKGQMQDVLRPAGGSHVIEPSTIHQLISLPEGECWTLVKAGPVVRRWRRYWKLIK